MKRIEIIIEIDDDQFDPNASTGLTEEAHDTISEALNFVCGIVSITALADA